MTAQPVTDTTIPDDLPGAVERHGRIVAANDQKAILADFRSDRIGQLVGSASLPPDLVSSEVLDLVRDPDGLFSAWIRYTAASGVRTVLRSRWIHADGGWRVNSVRNVPATPPRTGTEGPDTSEVDRPFWEGLAAGELRVQQCASCGTFVWSPRVLCPSCHGDDLRWPAVEPRGTVYSWTRTWQPFHPSLAGHLPFVVVLAEIPSAGGRRLLGVLDTGDTTDGADIAVGRPVEAVIDRPDGEGWPVLRWRLA
ncbi:Zn-ribbon domain-containing OB-fold protein [Actinomycetospora sp. TBRC 11914]|uniref:Zn-ribbon domain-containing OB-fold protein n=1 Tax=Actinomycetospora sp. TBRC 11914 TaxID=2729387 RepID=UPI00145CE360|nr:zinc ribbon domain-containing protein [Actinomycetospora sp. TBRC 11914]NMO91572.1 hypothetical protein [Actinomycetospora sp. TBRC 11914]